MDFSDQMQDLCNMLIELSPADTTEPTREKETLHDYRQQILKLRTQLRSKIEKVQAHGRRIAAFIQVAPYKLTAKVARVRQGSTRSHRPATKKTTASKSSDSDGGPAASDSDPHPSLSVHQLYPFSQQHHRFTPLGLTSCVNAFPLGSLLVPVLPICNASSSLRVRFAEVRHA